MSGLRRWSLSLVSCRYCTDIIIIIIIIVIIIIIIIIITWTNMRPIAPTATTSGNIPAA